MIKKVKALKDSLERFVIAQDSCYEYVLRELRSEEKRSHWMWYIFPQLRGLGHSEYANHFGLQDLNESKAFLKHVILGDRYRECLGLLEHSKRDAEEIFGVIDAKKLQSSLTLFLHVEPDSMLFMSMLRKFYKGELDKATLEILKNNNLKVAKDVLK